ncbi:hypothetical protein HPP92_009793 [Vanilla planifolia]|uniref:Morc S5 domain-containing protein n=1 Tax=Vanilla planifolia TaxID=51239 RepID=A0A835RB95_VANPL|nr:hypothetical protein HPP92_009793 [Vanilla planifolia]
MKSAAKLEMSDATDGLSSQDRCRLLEAPPQPTPTIVAAAFIDLSSSESDSEGEIEDGLMESDEVEGTSKRRKADGKMMASLPPGFLDPLPSAELLIRAPQLPRHQPVAARPALLCSGSRQFWKAGDFEGVPAAEDSVQPSMGIDHVRVHPKFLHSNATSHKWALGAIAELLDNALDEVCNGATFVNIDMLLNKKDESRMLLIEDNGGGMDPDKMRQCMSLVYSRENKIANCIGQYGNGFKNSTMRLGADVIIFSQCSGKQGKSIIQSIGMLSYTYLRNTGKEDVVVPMLHYEKRGTISEKLMRSSVVDWNKNVDTIVQWSLYLNEDDLLQQFSSMSDHGTRILIYNLWEDDQGKLELDFDADKFDIQISGFNGDEKRIQMAKQFPNSKHFFTYRHSLRSYASILYLRLPHAFRMILRGKEIEHHNIVNDMILKQEVTYHPNTGSDGIPKYSNMVAVITIGFVKDAKHHVNFHGFNVYHKNRLIKLSKDGCWREFSKSFGGESKLWVVVCEHENAKEISRLVEGEASYQEENFPSRRNGMLVVGGLKLFCEKFSPVSANMPQNWQIRKWPRLVRWVKLCGMSLSKRLWRTMRA